MSLLLYYILPNSPFDENIEELHPRTSECPILYMGYFNQMETKIILTEVQK